MEPTQDRRIEFPATPEEAKLVFTITVTLQTEGGLAFAAGFTPPMSWEPFDPEVAESMLREVVEPRAGSYVFTMDGSGTEVTAPEVVNYETHFCPKIFSTTINP